MAYKNKTFSHPLIVLKAIIYTNIIMFVVSLIFSREHLQFSLNPLLFLTPSPLALEFLGATGKAIILKYGTWWSIITANWLHGGLLHILFNMLALRTLIPLVIKEFGVARMFSLYTLTGMAGFLLSYVGNVNLTIGASSGICGLIGALLYFGKSRGGQWGRSVYKETIGWVISLVLFGFIFSGIINNWSHAGGLLSGIVLGWIFGYNEKRRENNFDKILAISFAFITVCLLSKAVIEGFLLIYF